MPSSRASLSLVVPAYNEADVIRQTVREAYAALNEIADQFEILLVDDGSRDDTADIVSRMVPAYPRLRLIRHRTNRGYGAALRSGFEAARHPLVAFTDADCQFDLSDLRPMIARIVDAPIVVGYRARRQDPLRRKLYSRGYNLLVRALLGTGVRDCDCALKLFRHEVLADLLPTSRGFFVNAEMLTRARQHGHAVVEVPVTHRPRAGGESKVSVREVPRILKILLGFWWREVVWASRPVRAVGAVQYARLPATQNSEARRATATV